MALNIPCTSGITYAQPFPPVESRIWLLCHRGSHDAINIYPLQIALDLFSDIDISQLYGSSQNECCNMVTEIRLHTTVLWSVWETEFLVFRTYRI